MDRGRGPRRRDPARAKGPVARRLTRAAIVGAALSIVACGGGTAEPPPEPFVARPPLAGVSANVDFQVDAIRPGDFGADTTGALWSRFNHRCSGCHVAPSPAQYPSGSWREVVDRMSAHVESAGLLSLEEDETEAIVDLLDRHAPGGIGAASSER